MQREVDLVGHWHDTFGVPRREPGVLLDDAIAVQEFVLRTKLISEEGSELANAILADDLVEIADGVADTMYVIAGTYAQLGLPVDESYENKAVYSLVRDAVSSMLLALGGAAATENVQVRQEYCASFRRHAVHAEVLCLGIAAKYGFDYSRVFDEVHRSNMSKMSPDGTITRNEFGKVIKPPTYSPADLSFVLAAAADPNEH